MFYFLFFCSSPKSLDLEDDIKRESISLAFESIENEEVFVQGTLNVSIQEDGTEYVTGKSLVKITSLELHMTEEVLLDKEGLVVSWKQSIKNSLGISRIRYEHELDASSKTVSSIVDGIAYTTSWEDEGAIIMQAIQSDLHWQFNISSPVVGHVVSRAMQSSDPRSLNTVLVYPSWRGVWSGPSIPASPCSYLATGTYCYDLDGTLVNYDPNLDSFFAEPIVSRTDNVTIDDLEPINSNRVADDDFTIPDRGDRHFVHTLIAQDGTEIAARILIPEGDGPFPTLVIVPESPGLDRSGVSYGEPIWDGLAADLLSRGIAVASFDSRGIGQSGGVYAERYSAQNEDAATLIQALREDPLLGELILFGHGGSVAGDLRDLDAEATILVDAHSGTGASAFVFKNVQYNRPYLLHQDFYEDLEADVNAFLEPVIEGTYIGEHFNSLSVSEWWQPYLSTDLTAAALEVPGSVLLLKPEFGGRSSNTDQENLFHILQESGRTVEQVEIPGIGFYLQPAIKKELGYEYPLPFRPVEEVGEAIVNFIDSLEDS